MFRAARRRTNPADGRLAEMAAALMTQVSTKRLRYDVATLPTPRGRLHWPQNMRAADERILKEFHDAGWQAQKRPFHLTNVDGYLDLGTLTTGEWGPTLYEQLSGANIVASRDGGESLDTVVVGAHHDTIRDSPGADDNTASVAALLELARVLQNCTFRRSIMLVAFDMEELGMHGSRQFVREFPVNRRLLGTIVFETMSYTSKEPGSQKLPPGLGGLYPRRVRQIRTRGCGDWAAILYRKASEPMARMFEENLSLTKQEHAAITLRDPLDLPVLGPILGRIMPSVRNFARSDHVPFWQAKRPAILIGDTADFRNPHYHQPTDMPDTLDYEHLKAIVAATALTLYRLAGITRNTG